MKTLRAVVVRFAGLFRRKQREDEMNEELRAHLDALTERNLAAGMSVEEARFGALREFGGVEQIKERARDERRSAWGEHFLRDVRYAARQLWKTPGFTAVAVLSLALGIGANTAIFSALDRVLLRPLPVPKPDELVRFQWMAGAKGGRPETTQDDHGRIDPETGRPIGEVFSHATFEAFRAQHPMLSEIFAFTRPRGFLVEIDGQAAQDARGQVVSGGYHVGLGVGALAGRTLLPDDDRPGAPAVTVISHGFWQRRFGGDVAVVGKTIFVNRTPVTIVGVMPPDFVDPISVFGEQPFSFPLAMLPLLEPDVAAKSKPGFWWIRIMGRLQPGATRAQVAASLQASFASSTRDGVTEKNDPPLLLVAPGGHGLAEGRRANANTLLVLTGMAALVLAACANVANLLLARGAARRRELAVRLALGAGRGRLIRQLLTESALLAFLGATLGLLLAWWGGALLPFVGARGGDVIDFRVFGFTSTVALLTGVGFGLVPALRATRVDLTAEFQGGTRQLGGGGRTRLSKTLLVIQVAVSLVLLVGAGLFVRTLRNLRAIDIGFSRENLLLFYLDAAPAGYKPEQSVNLHRRIAERIESLPGVRSVTFSTTPLLGNNAGMHYRIEVPGRPPSPSGEAARVNRVGKGFFETLGVSIMLGRSLEVEDDTPTSQAAVVNQAFVNKFFPEENPLGRRFTGPYRGELEIVGVVRDVQQATLRTPTLPTVFVPFARSPQAAVTFAVRTSSDPAALVPSIRAAVQEIERLLPISNLRTQERQIESMASQERSFARLTSFFGGLALALVCIGLYGLMSYAVVRRTGEIGLRMALGALPGQVLRMVLSESLLLVLVGVALGIGGAMAAVRLVANLLYGLSPTDAATYGVVTLLLVVIALAAAFFPARRAAKIDPMAALRAE